MLDWCTAGAGDERFQLLLSRLTIAGVDAYFFILEVSGRWYNTGHIRSNKVGNHSRHCFAHPLSFNQRLVACNTQFPHQFDKNKKKNR